MRAIGCVPFVALLVSGCQSPFAPPSEVRELRVLGTRAVPASGSPGASVALELLVADGAPAPEGAPARSLELAWLGGCHNPPTRQFFACYPYLQAVAASAPSRLRDVDPVALPPGSLGFGDGFELRIPEDILSAAPRVPSDPTHFGVSYVFFAACAGELHTRPELADRVPLACIDPETGGELGLDDFVTGFATVFSYEGAVNENPSLEAVTFDGMAVVDLECIEDTDCEDLPPAEAGPFACSPRGRCARRVRACAANAESCPVLRVVPEIARASAERLPSGEAEIVWSKFYATGGQFNHDAQLVNDRKTGWVDGVASGWRPPRGDAGFVKLWVTLHDQRGGTDFRSFEVVVGE